MHHCIGIVHWVYYDITNHFSLIVLLLRPSCLTPDFCNHSGRSLPINGILLILAPTSYLRQNPLRKYAAFVLHNCTLLRHQNFLWTSFSLPPTQTIAYQIPHPLNGTVIDLFSGIGTWAYAARYLSEHQVVCSIDIDRQSLLTQAEKPLFELHSQLYQPPTRPFLLRHDLTDYSILPLLSILSPDLLCASPPCPPWSNAGRQFGFNRTDGYLTLYCLFYSFYLQTPIVFEQVSAFTEHPHFILFTLVAQILGLTIRFQQLTNASSHVPVSRNRVLICCDPYPNTPRGYIAPWQLPTPTTPTLRTHHFLPTNSIHLTDPCLTPTPEELEVLRDPTLIPNWYPHPHAPVLQRRFRYIGDILGAIMASYPKQTLLPYNLLQLNGLYTELVPISPTAIRRFHPLEWAAALGWSSILRLPLNLHDAWHQLGNTLSPQQTLYGLCLALSNSEYAYDFHSVLSVMQRDSLNLTFTHISTHQERFYAENSTDSLTQFVPPTLPFIYTIQSELYHAPRNLLFRSTNVQQVIPYLQHETYFAFLDRLRIESTTILTPFNSRIFPSATMMQLHLQHRFLNTTQFLHHTLPEQSFPSFITFQSRTLTGSLYLINDLKHNICIVNWTLGSTTGSYHTTARTLSDVIAEWTPLTPFFTHIHTNTALYVDISDTIPNHESILFSLHVPRTFHLRFLTITSTHTTIHVRMATSLTMDYLYYLLGFSLD